MKAWLIRAGRSGERDAFALEHGLAGGGFKEVADLSGANSREEVAALVEAAFPDAKPGKITNHAAQLWALRSRIQLGDLIVLPLKTTSQIAIGKATSGYVFRDDADPDFRHFIGVEWLRTDLPRTAFLQDLLFSLGAAMTICEIRRNDAVWRLQQVLETGVDPGSRTGVDDASESDAETSDLSTTEIDLERAARDRIQSFIAERFAGHALAALVQAVLVAEGFHAESSPPGPDGGIDVLAGRGLFGLDEPRIIAQVKSSPTPVDVKVVRELHGVLTTHGADQGLLVAWGGINKKAKDELKNQFFRIRVWDSDDLIDALIRSYPKLPEELRAELPLKEIWTVVEEPTGGS
jgi:restriction system protein